jgi:hypothetical protein
MICISGILMAAFTVSLIILDMWFWRSGRIVTHVFLGGIITALFFALCQHGYELVNWSLLGLLIISLSIILFKSNNTSNTEYAISKQSLSCPCDT